jgi:hypothetical protein
MGATNTEDSREGGMAQVENKAEIPKEPDDPVKNIIGNALGALLAAIFAGLSFLTFHYGDSIGWGLAGLIWLAEIVLIGALTAKFVRDFGVLGAGADATGSRKRRAYDVLRNDLQNGDRPAILYNEWLRKFLDAVDRFFGDAGGANRTLFPHAFGLKTAAPLWTAPAFDRCMMLASIYPIATISLFWIVSGHTGQAETALFMDAGLSGWQRGIAATVIGLAIFLLWRFNQIPAASDRQFLAYVVFGVALLAGGPYALSAVMFGLYPVPGQQPDQLPSPHVTTATRFFESDMMP